MPNPFIATINSLLPEPQASLLNGILFGVKATMPKSFYYGLRDTGLLHIIALSGMNISILVNLLGRMTLWLGRKRSIILTISGITLFVIFVGTSPSIIRAAIMGSISLIAVYFGKLNWGLLSLILASILMLLIDISYLFSISFQLSVAATFGIILAGRYIKCQNPRSFLRKLKGWMIDNFILTLAAQLFTLPIIIYNFHQLSLISPLANLLVEWTIQPVMLLGFVTALLGRVWFPLGALPAFFVWVFLTYFIEVVQFLAKIPFSSVKF